MSLREEFEQWLADYEFRRASNGWMPLERSVQVRMQDAWQASRKALEVELPSSGTAVGKAYVAHCRAAIEAAGVRVKP